MTDDNLGPFDLQAIVIETGTQTVKCGFSGDDEPNGLFLNVHGAWRSPFMAMGDAQIEYVGESVYRKGSSQLFIRRPIPVNGSPVNFRYLERIFYHVFYRETRITPEEHPIFLTDLPDMRENDMSRMMDIMFETFGVPYLYIANPSVISIFENGRTSGLVVDSGYGGTRIVPVYECHPIQHLSLKMEDPRNPNLENKGFGGFLVTNILIDLMSQTRGYEMTTKEERSITNDIKEKLCYISTDFEKDISEENDEKNFEKEYALPDNSKLVLGKELFRAPETIFQPQLIGRNCRGVHEFVLRSLQKSDPDLQSTLSNNIIITGGNSLYPGFRERLEREVSKTRFCKVDATETRKFGSWIGGSIITSVSTFTNEWVSKREFEEYGSVIGRRKCHMSLMFPDGELFRLECDEDIWERINFMRSDSPSFRIITGSITIQLPSKTLIQI